MEDESSSEEASEQETSEEPQPVIHPFLGAGIVLYPSQKHAAKSKRKKKEYHNA